MNPGVLVSLARQKFHIPTAAELLGPAKSPKIFAGSSALFPQSLSSAKTGLAKTENVVIPCVKIKLNHMNL